VLNLKTLNFKPMEKVKRKCLLVLFLLASFLSYSQKAKEKEKATSDGRYVVKIVFTALKEHKEEFYGGLGVYDISDKNASLINSSYLKGMYCSFLFNKEPYYFDMTNLLEEGFFMKVFSLRNGETKQINHITNILVTFEYKNKYYEVKFDDMVLERK
jgi:hypothetical protein